jgi:hypothetical protein
MKAATSRRWILPLALLALLVVTSYFRWEVLEETATGDSVVKWELDRWTREIWVVTYSSFDAHERISQQLAGDPQGSEASAVALKTEKTLTRVRDLLAALMILWLFLESQSR